MLKKLLIFFIFIFLLVSIPLTTYWLSEEKKKSEISQTTQQTNSGPRENSNLKQSELSNSSLSPVQEVAGAQTKNKGLIEKNLHILLSGIGVILIAAGALILLI